MHQMLDKAFVELKHAGLFTSAAGVEDEAYEDDDYKDGGEEEQMEEEMEEMGEDVMKQDSGEDEVMEVGEPRHDEPAATPARSERAMLPGRAMSRVPGLASGAPLCRALHRRSALCLPRSEADAQSSPERGDAGTSFVVKASNDLSAYKDKGQPVYDFKIYDLDGHRVTRCAKTTIVMDSSSTLLHGAFLFLKVNGRDSRRQARAGSSRFPSPSLREEGSVDGRTQKSSEPITAQQAMVSGDSALPPTDQLDVISPESIDA
ncbi:uncharacterized protein B0T15DRAFT_168329 [Chaetomium strumarium]|uniref:Uncharacterized protein n=1 Tax=Chaetomium strumarium TaxID=1170767 RepID=A0AAJ0GW98_9PEZI|nr:hypothetical protein B0T15DRAFT_168329 [Chaetomium strumarium]